MQRIIKKLPKKFYLLLLLGFFWIVALFFVMLMQNKFIPLSEDSTVKTLAAGQKKTISNEPITPLPVTLDLNLQKVTLGMKLFHDKQLSSNGTVSCATCHDLARGGVDNLPFSFGVNGAKGNRNAPTVFNSGFNYRQFWDGRAVTLEQQVDGPLQNEKEMATSWEVVIQKLSTSPDYPELFKRAYGKKHITPVEVRDAIAEFERALTTPNSRFDLWLNGQESALSASQKNGYKLFKSYGCVSCHHGINIGGSMFEKIGVFNEFYRTHPSEDTGRFAITSDENALYEFKVPSLRNVAQTQPYMHDSSVKTLHGAIDFMAHYQLGIKLSESEINDIEDFLNSLSGDKPSVLK
jgi:cytochrome c peroxidase